MKALVQRTRGRTAIAIDGRAGGEFEGPGLIVLLGWLRDDEARADLATAEAWLLDRILGLRIFPDTEGKLNLSLPAYLDANASSGGILWVSQFTLAAELASGFRPSFTDALGSESARARYEAFVDKITAAAGAYPRLRSIYGSFGADMDLTFTNWGPVTIPLHK